MTDPSSVPPQPGERRLVHPPSDRYRTPETEAPAVDTTTSAGRGVAYAAMAAVLGAIAMTVLGGILAVSAGLLVVAAVTGWAIAVGLRTGAGSDLPASSRLRVALLLATLAVAGGLFGLWLYARSEGGVLGPFDYLAETFGVLVPIEFAIALAVSWATAR